jgi:hypothetical protein
MKATLSASRVPGDKLSTMERPVFRNAVLSAAISLEWSPPSPNPNMSSALMKSRPHSA